MAIAQSAEEALRLLEEADLINEYESSFPRTAFKRDSPKVYALDEVKVVTQY